MHDINDLQAISQPLVTHIYTADPSAHVFDGKIYIYPSHDIEAGIPFDDLGSHFAMEDYHVLSMDTPDLKEFLNMQAIIRRNKDTLFTQPSTTAPIANDKGLTGPLPWYDTNYIGKGWRTIAIPGYWEDQGVKDLNGVVWYRREINIPASMTGQPAKVFLGRIVDADLVYINGRQIGQTTYLYPQRRYSVPAGILKPGKNRIVVKVTNNSGKGGFVPDKPYYLFAGTDTIDLKGYWQYKVGEVFRPRAVAASINPQNQPTALFNAMIAPLTNYTIKGFLWYQGEANTAMAIAIDAGEWNDIHPDNKKIIGERLALAAMNLAYGEQVEYTGPLFKAVSISGATMVIEFTHTGSGLISIDDEPLTQFAIAGADKKFVWANARIDGDKVVVWSDRIAHPLYVRYAWADNPAGANLYNKEGLPASPFRTD